MKLEIDTQRDSKEDLKAAIAMLQNLVGETPSSYTAPVEEDIPDIEPAAFDMFGGPLEASEPIPEPVKEEDPAEKITFMEY
jgi:hypothetical protein